MTKGRRTRPFVWYAPFRLVKELSQAFRSFRYTPGDRNRNRVQPFDPCPHMMRCNTCRLVAADKCKPDSHTGFLDRLPCFLLKFS